MIGSLEEAIKEQNRLYSETVQYCERKGFKESWYAERLVFLPVKIGFEGKTFPKGTAPDVFGDGEWSHRGLWETETWNLDVEGFKDEIVYKTKFTRFLGETSCEQEVLFGNEEGRDLFKTDFKVSMVEEIFKGVDVGKVDLANKGNKRLAFWIHHEPRFGAVVRAIIKKGSVSGQMFRPETLHTNEDLHTRWSNDGFLQGVLGCLTKEDIPEDILEDAGDLHALLSWRSLEREDLPFPWLDEKGEEIPGKIFKGPLKGLKNENYGDGGIVGKKVFGRQRVLMIKSCEHLCNDNGFGWGETVVVDAYGDGVVEVVDYGYDNNCFGCGYDESADVSVKSIDKILTTEKLLGFIKSKLV